jgi:DNA-binding response OmpR family regulator
VNPGIETLHFVGADLAAHVPLADARIARVPAPTRVLVVDDDPHCRSLVARTVARAGFHTDTARDGEEGWSALRTIEYDLLITDNEMPRLDGIRMIRRLRAIAQGPPCILMTGNPPDSEAALRTILHPGTVLAKPFTCLALMEKVFSLLMRGA